MKDEVSSENSVRSRFISIKGSKMHYLEGGFNSDFETTFLFLHGNPTSSYLWRNIIPHLTSLGRCIAPDLIGFGKSDKPNIQYTFQDHYTYINEFIS
jgi:haloalkane dehalogenase